jgi:Na+/phosphate symporter
MQKFVHFFESLQMKFFMVMSVKFSHFEELLSVNLVFRVTRWLEKIGQIFQRIAQKVAKSKKGRNIYNKAQFESPKHLHLTTFWNLKIPTTNRVLKLLI